VAFAGSLPSNIQSSGSKNDQLALLRIEFLSMQLVLFFKNLYPPRRIEPAMSALATLSLCSKKAIPKRSEMVVTGTIEVQKWEGLVWCHGKSLISFHWLLSLESGLQQLSLSLLLFESPSSFIRRGHKMWTLSLWSKLFFLSFSKTVQGLFHCNICSSAALMVFAVFFVLLFCASCRPRKCAILWTNFLETS